MIRVYVSQRVDTVQSYQERRDALDQRWAEFLMQTGALALSLPNHEGAVKALLAAAPPDGILLSGGNSPVSCGGDAPERDAVDELLIQYAAGHGIPLVGVCRGMQSLALAFGGAIQPVEGHVAVRHAVDGTIARTVNSYHTLAALEVPDGFEALATDACGVVEAMRHSRWPLLGLMWHPEREAVFHTQDIELFRTWWRKEEL